jgi:hypothetical protein
MSQLARIVAFTALLAGCGGAGLVGNGKPVTENRTVGAFKTIELSGGVHVAFSKGPRAVAITADENLIAFVQARLEGDALVVWFTRPIADPAAIKVAVSNDVLEGVLASGGSVFAGPVTPVPNLALLASGGSKLEVSEVASSKVFVDASGGSQITVTGGATTDLNATVSGASHFVSHGFASEAADVNLSGASTACVQCSKSVRGNASGASTLTVSGKPAVAEVNASGGSRLIKVE